MRIHVLAPDGSNNASRYPRRKIVEEFEDVALVDVIEEIVPPAGGWMVAYEEGRVSHFYADQGQWHFQSTTTFPREENSNAEQTAAH